MPLIFATIGQTVHISAIQGKKEMRERLTGLGFVPSASVKILSAHNGSLIVQLKDTRVAIDHAVASQIIVS